MSYLRYWWQSKQVSILSCIHDISLFSLKYKAHSSSVVANGTWQESTVPFGHLCTIMRMMTAKWWLLIRTWAILPAQLSHVGPCINDGHCRVHLIAWGNCPGTEELYMNSQTYGTCCWSLCSDMFGYIIVAIKRTAVWTGSNSFLGFACPWLHFLIKIPVYPCVFLHKSSLALMKLRGQGGAMNIVLYK